MGCKDATRLDSYPIKIFICATNTCMHLIEFQIFAKIYWSWNRRTVRLFGFQSYLGQIEPSCSYFKLSKMNWKPVIIQRCLSILFIQIKTADKISEHVWKFRSSNWHTVCQTWSSSMWICNHMQFWSPTMNLRLSLTSRMNGPKPIGIGTTFGSKKYLVNFGKTWTTRKNFPTGVDWRSFVKTASESVHRWIAKKNLASQ